jgi:sodium/proline symporter
MERSTAILIAFGCYLAGLFVLGWLANVRTRDAASFYLGGRTLGPWVAALAANASSSSAWSLVGVSGFAYRHGLSALWILPGSVGGFVLNWLLVAPRLRDRTGGAVTLTEFLAGPPGARGQRAFVVAASLLTLASLGAYVAAQMQAAGGAFTHAFALPPWIAIVLGAAITVGYTLVGGYLAASLTDTLQGLLMVVVAVLVPIAAVVRIGGPGPFADALAAVDEAHFGDLLGGRTGMVAFGFALSMCGIGLGYPGQPHAVNKYMGMAPGASMAVARTVGITWAVVLYTGMLVVGWAVRVLWQLPAGAHEDALYVASRQLFPPLVDGLILAAVLAAIMSTVDSQLLVCASCVTYDLGGLQRSGAGTLRGARSTVVAIGAAATLAALLLEKNVFDHVLFAWAALGSAFGPLLLVRLCIGPVPAPWALGSLLVGGSLAIAGFYLPVLAPGFADRVLSWLVALVVAWLGARRQPGPAT